MRSLPTSLVAVLVVAALMLPAPGMMWASGNPAPMDSNPDHQAGFLNTTFTDSASSSLDMTMFYPARTAGEDTIKDVSGAPYPGLLVVHDPTVGPTWTYWRSYGEHLSRRGYVVGLLDLEPYDGSTATDYDAMVNATLDAIEHIAVLDDTSGTNMYGMVNLSAMSVLGFGPGAAVALRAVLRDASDLVHGVIGIRMAQLEQGTGTIHWGTGGMDIPVMFLESSLDDTRNAEEAFDQKANGYVSLMNIDGANHTQFLDNSSVDSISPPADINHTDQLVLAKKYILAFLDFHMKGDTLAGSKIYGSQAAADLADGTLTDWRHGVLDQSIDAVNPTEGASFPDGPVAICATVSNVGPFPMPLRNVTLEVARVLPGPAYQTVFGPINRTVPAQTLGAETTVTWTPTLTVYGDYVAFLKMDDPDHNASNDRVQRGFSIVPLLRPTIDHDPPDSLELGEVYNLTCRIVSPSGIAEAHVNYSDEEGFRQELTLTEHPVTGDHYVHLPAPRSLGQVNYKIFAKATNGATNLTNPFYVAVVDTTPPRIEHSPPSTQLPVLSQVELNATVTDAGGIDKVHLLYTEPATGFHNVTCGRVGDLWFYPVILGPVGGMMEYSWYAVDTWGNDVTSPNYSIELVDDEPPVIVPVPPDPVELGEDVLLEARVTDSSLLEGVWVLLTRPGEDGEVNATPAFVNDLYRYTVTNLTAAGTLTYSWWARDMNGHTTTTGDLTVDVRDTTPPEISDIATGDAEVGKQPWVQANVLDAAGLDSVTLTYVDVGGTPGSIAMEEVLPDIYEARIPQQPMGGAISYRIVAVDPSGNQADSGDRTMVVRDLEPPVIVHVPPQDLVEGQEVTFEAEVTDNVGVAEVWLYLRLSSTASYRRLAMENVDGDVYGYTLAQGELLHPNVMYYFEAEDMPPSSNLVTDPDGAPAVSYLLNVTERLLRLNGTVKASGGDPIKGATVSLVGVGSSVTTDEEGRYEFTDLLSGPYIFEVTAEGYEGMSTNLILSAESGDRQLDVTLVPKVSSDGDDEGLPWTLVAALVIFGVIAIIIIIALRAGARRE